MFKFLHTVALRRAGLKVMTNGVRADCLFSYLSILTDPGLLRSGTRLHWFVAVVLLILEAVFCCRDNMQISWNFRENYQI